MLRWPGVNLSDTSALVRQVIGRLSLLALSSLPESDIRRQKIFFTTVEVGPRVFEFVYCMHAM